MARSSTTIKKGQVLNPKGRPRVPVQINEIRKLTLQKYTELIDKLINAGPEEIKAFISRPGATVLEIYIAKIIQKGIGSGDTSRMSFLLERLLPPVKQRIDHSSEDGSMTPKYVIEIVDEQSRNKN